MTTAWAVLAGIAIAAAAALKVWWRTRSLTRERDAARADAVSLKVERDAARGDAAAADKQVELAVDHAEAQHGGHAAAERITDVPTTGDAAHDRDALWDRVRSERDGPGDGHQGGGPAGLRGVRRP